MTAFEVLSFPLIRAQRVWQRFKTRSGTVSERKSLECGYLMGVRRHKCLETAPFSFKKRCSISTAAFARAPTRGVAPLAQKARENRARKELIGRSLFAPPNERGPARRPPAPGARRLWQQSGGRPGRTCTSTPSCRPLSPSIFQLAPDKPTTGWNPWFLL